MDVHKELEYNLIPFSIEVECMPAEFNIRALIEQFIGFPGGIIKCTYSEDPAAEAPEEIKIKYPKNKEELDNYSEVIDFKKPISIYGDGFSVKYFPEGYELEGTFGDVVFEFLINDRDNEILDSVCSMVNIPGFPQDFTVYHKKDERWSGGMDFFKILDNQLYSQLPLE